MRYGGVRRGTEKEMLCRQIEEMQREEEGIEMRHTSLVKDLEDAQFIEPKTDNEPRRTEVEVKEGGS
jgi:hypothetical protein